jgi:IclR family acetate operon transcriptional repressor
LPNQPAPPPRSLVSRITAILSTFVSGESHTVTEIAHMTGLPVSTTHRLVVELASWQLLQRASDGRYEIGLTLHRLGGDIRPLPTLFERAPHVVTDLCAATGRRARLGVLRGERIAYIEKRVGPDPATPFCAGATLPAHATALGKAILAFAPRDTVASVEQRLTRHTANTLTRPDRLRDALQRIRLTGTAVAHGELTPGDWAVAVPVFGPGGMGVAALELGLQDLHADVELCTAALAVAARGLSRELAVDAFQPHRRPLRLLRGPGAGVGVVRSGPARPEPLTDLCPESLPGTAARLAAARGPGRRRSCDTVRSG